MLSRSLRSLPSSLAIGLLAALLLAAPCDAADLFGRPEAEPPAAPAALSPPGAAAAVLAPLPAPLRLLLGRALAVQNQLNADLRGALRQAKNQGSWRPAWAIVTLSFLYGVFHAAGPGHGKLVVGSYFLTRRARILHGLAMSGAAAAVQAVSAVVLVSLLAVVLSVSSGRILQYAGTLETASYGLITALGLWMAWGALSRRACCDHAAEPGHHHDHDHGHDHPSELKRILATGAAVGLRPCSGAILVLLFTLANAIYPVGVLATFAMALGVAITVSAVSLTTLGLHRSLAVLGPDRRALADRLRQAAALTGALVIALFGILQLIGIWTGVITPMAG